MLSRTFRDSEGRAWSAHQIEPADTLVERRDQPDRRGPAAVDAGEPPIVERRRTPDRRTRAVLAHRTGLPGRWQRGWLLFEPADATPGDDPTARPSPPRRRLAPVPPGWARASDAELVAFLARAEEVRPRPAPGIDADATRGPRIAP